MALIAVALRSVIFSGFGGPVLQEVASVAQADLSSRAAIATREAALQAVETTPIGRPPLFSPAALAKELVFCWSLFAEEHVAESAGVHGSASWLEALTGVMDYF